MRRTQISLEEWQYQALLALSGVEGKSLALLIREAIDERLARQASRKRDKLDRIKGLGSDVTVSGRDHDAVLYALPPARALEVHEPRAPRPRRVRRRNSA